MNPYLRPYTREEIAEIDRLSVEIGTKLKIPTPDAKLIVLQVIMTFGGASISSK